MSVFKVAERCWRYDAHKRTVELLMIPAPALWVMSAVSLTVHAGGLALPGADLRWWIAAALASSLAISRLEAAPGIIGILNGCAVPVILATNVPNGHLVEHVDIAYYDQLLWLVPALLAQMLVARWYNARTS